MACSYCHNPELVKGELQKLPAEQVLSFLESRRGLLESVVLSGGECTLSPSLPEFTAHLKSLGYKIKIDTNGTNPGMLEHLLHEGLLDFVALDFKAPRNLFASITGSEGYDLFERSLRLLCRAGIGLEVRTTIHADLLNADDINTMIDCLNEADFGGTYFLQNFCPGKTLGNIGLPIASFDVERIKLNSISVEFRNF